MKRSEMCEILDDAIFEYTDCGTSCCNLGIDHEALSNILLALEKAGMLPPRYFPEGMKEGYELCGLAGDIGWEDETTEE